MPFPNFTGQVNTSNYFSQDGSYENLTLLSGSAKIGRNGNLSIGVGNDFNLNPNGSYTNKPAVEVKYSQNYGKTELFGNDVNFRGYARYQHIGGKNKLRVTSGVSVPVNKKLSLYTDAHYTTGFEPGKDKAGFWVGGSYKVNKHLSLWAEPYQMNFNLSTGEHSRLHNICATYKF